MANISKQSALELESILPKNVATELLENLKQLNKERESNDGKENE